jgi:hypothetical protein
VFEAETKSFVEGEHAEDAQLVTFDEYGTTVLGPIRVTINGATIIQGVDGEATLSDSPNVTVYLPSLEAVAGGPIIENHAIIMRGKTHPVRVEPRKNAHGLANIMLLKALA